MRDLQRNCQTVFFKNYLGQEEILDQYENSTGSFVPSYSELKSVRICVSPNKGSSEANMFGTLLEYDRTMTTANAKCEIDEHSVLWVDGADTNGPWNYIVKARSPWFNSVAYAIQKVDITTVEQEMQLMQEYAKP